MTASAVKKADPKLQSLYCSHMEEIKRRDALLREVFSGKKTLGSESYDYEVFALNIRKILELIAFASLIANKKKYAEAYKKFEQHYKAKAILTDMEKIHPDFYPQPTKIKKNPDGIHVMQDLTKANALTKDEFGELYDKCAKVLHVWNPFDPSPRQVNFRLSPIAWLDKVRNLLDQHYFRLVDGAGYWLCVMADGKDRRVHVYTLTPFEPIK